MNKTEYLKVADDFLSESDNENLKVKAKEVKSEG
jgi:hypothetical protein